MPMNSLISTGQFGNSAFNQGTGFSLPTYNAMAPSSLPMWGNNAFNNALGQGNNFLSSPVYDSPGASLQQMINSGDYANMSKAFGAGIPGADSNSLLKNLGGLQGIGMGLQGLASLGGIFGGMKQYGLAKKQFAFQKEAYKENLENQKKLTNSRLEDRQKARHAANPYQAERPEDYMKKYGV